jgi:HlyD family type I secretion membrane fusion protein
MIRTADTFKSWHSKLQLSNRKQTVIGTTVILLTLGVGVVWGSIAPISGAAIAPGIIVATGQNKTVQHLEGGIIDEILVREGETLQAGQTIIRLNQTAALANLTRMATQYDALRAIDARYLAERDGKDTIRFPADMLERKNDPATAEVLDGQEREFAARRAALTSQLAVLEKQIAATSEQITGLEAQVDAANRQMGLVQEELKDTQGLYDQGLAQKSRVLSLERAAAELLGNKGQLIAQIAQARQTIAETESRILGTRQAWMEKAVAEMRDVQIQVADFAERLKAAQDVATRIQIKAPVAGVVVKIHYNTLGGVIASGQPIVDILPASALEIQARVNPQDIKRVFAGSKANLRFPALRERTTPVMPGIVEFVSADRLTDPRTGEPYYTARIKVSDTLDAEEKIIAARLLPGMPAEVYVETGARTFFQYLLSPVTDILAHSFREP